MSLSAAVWEEADRFVPEGFGVEDAEAERADLKTFGRLSGFDLKGFTLDFRRTEDVVVIAATGFAENDSTTFSTPSSLFRPSSTGGGDPEEPEPEATGSSCSAFARSICSAINKRSRCSSDTVERSFLSAASYEGKGGQRIMSRGGFQNPGSLPASPTPSGCYQSKQGTNPFPSRPPAQLRFFLDASQTRST